MDRYQKLIQEKAKKKRELMGTQFFPRRPIILFDFSDKPVNGYKDLLEGLNAINAITLVIVPEGSKTKFPSVSNVHYLTPVKKNTAMAAADLVLVSHDEINTAWESGCVPISQLDGDGTINYNPLQEKGNGFYFKNPTKWEIFATIIRALETYQFPYDWENLIREITKK